MKNNILNIVKKYLDIFPNEKERLNIFLEYLNKTEDSKIIDWNNFDGHIVSSSFIYNKTDDEFLVLYHKDLKMYLYPGGHVDINDKNILEASKREVIEETGITNFKQIIINNDELIPLDIDTHLIEFNERLNLPKHYHFDFRYLFIVDKKENIKVDTDELGDYKWVNIDKLTNITFIGEILSKIKDRIK